MTAMTSSGAQDGDGVALSMLTTESLDDLGLIEDESVVLAGAPPPAAAATMMATTSSDEVAQMMAIEEQLSKLTTRLADIE
jgi:hypothetical protein